MIFTIKELLEHPQVGLKDGSWHLAKPYAWLGMGFIKRLKAAWLVLRNKAVVVRWY